MSYEGYREILCRRGHYRTCDAYLDDECTPCPICSADTAWTNEVDETNGFEVPTELETLVPAVTETCPACGAVKVVVRERYKIPDDGRCA